MYYVGVVLGVSWTAVMVGSLIMFACGKIPYKNASAE